MNKIHIDFNNIIIFCGEQNNQLINYLSKKINLFFPFCIIFIGLKMVYFIIQISLAKKKKI